LFGPRQTELPPVEDDGREAGSMTMQRRFGLVLVSGLLLSASPVHLANAAPPSRAEAFRFLNQATFGPTSAEIDRLIAFGDSSQAYAQWIDEQMLVEASLQLPAVQAKYATVKNVTVLQTTRQDRWFRNAMIAPDQLRQRVAFALSEIMVVSQHSVLAKMPFAAADYYDLLARSAFGDFRQLLEDVTLHPAMGVYLNMLANRKPDPARNIRPDENYARELMQLFSIGLVRLNPDGTVPTDGAGDPFPTYDQPVVEGFAHVFTGWHYAGASTFATAKRTNTSQIQPMKAYPEQHATGTKQLLNYPGVQLPVIPAGRTASQDLEAALDNIFNHPNVGPFIGRQLIQRLVTSNPSPAYVARITSVFNNDGQGRRGNLGAVVKAILLDPEARPAGAAISDITGKTKEPLLRLIQFWRAYDAAARNGVYHLASSDKVFGQGPLLSPTVFNFFRPSYAPPGEIEGRDLVAPELQIANEHLNTSVTNYFYTQIFLRNSTKTGLGTTIIVIDIADEVAAANDADALVALIADKLLGGAISPTLAGEARDAVLRVAATKRAVRATEALYLIATSPEFAVQR
jgi:uncharacterized protein (DUF1800 family)